MSTMMNGLRRPFLAVLLSSTAAILASAAAQAQALPERVATNGLSIGYADYPPDQYTDDKGAPVGWAVELLEAAAAEMGVEANLTLVGSFQSLLPGLNAKKYDLAVGGFSITAERKQQFDFVSYFNSGNSIVIRDGKDEITVETMCGHKAAIALGSYFATIVENFSTKCTEASKPAIELLTFPTQEAVLVALDSGRADFSVASLSASSYLSKQTQGRYRVSGEPFFRTTAGFAFDKSESEVRDAVAAALQKLVESGRYGAILAEWGIEQGAVDKIEINP